VKRESLPLIRDIIFEADELTGKTLLGVGNTGNRIKRRRKSCWHLAWLRHRWLVLAAAGEAVWNNKRKTMNAVLSSPWFLSSVKDFSAMKI
jgi:hypothetical protein